MKKIDLPSTRPTLIIDYGLGNLLSLRRALQNVGAEPRVSSNPAHLAGADRIILPGVGSFAEASKILHKEGFAEEILKAAARGVPILGICLGMQVLFDLGMENGVSPGLELLPGTVQRLLGGDISTLPRTHIGWRNLENLPKDRDSNSANQFSDGPFYFIHSYGVVPGDSAVVQATVAYGEQDIPAIVQKDNILGFQFHPEKSRNLGLALLKNFCSPGTFD